MKRLPRKKKKVLRDAIITYDIQSLPSDGRISVRESYEFVIENLRESSVLFYSSYRSDGTRADKPEVYPRRLRSKIALKKA